MTLMDPLLLHEAWQMLYNNNPTVTYHSHHEFGGLYNSGCQWRSYMLTSEPTVTALFKNTQAVKFKSLLHNGVLHYCQSLLQSQATNLETQKHTNRI